MVAFDLQRGMLSHGAYDGRETTKFDDASKLRTSHSNKLEEAPNHSRRDLEVQSSSYDPIGSRKNQLSRQMGTASQHSSSTKNKIHVEMKPWNIETDNYVKLNVTAGRDNNVTLFITACRCLSKIPLFPIKAFTCMGAGTVESGDRDFPIFRWELLLLLFMFLLLNEAPMMSCTAYRST